MSMYIHEAFVYEGVVSAVVDLDIDDTLDFADHCMAEQLYCQMLGWV